MAEILREMVPNKSHLKSENSQTVRENPSGKFCSTHTPSSVIIVIENENLD